MHGRTFLLTATSFYCSWAAPSAHAQQGLMHEGLPHQVVGAASLSVDANDALLVTNAGGNGHAGVVIEIGAAEAHSIRLVMPPPIQAPPGAQYELTSTAKPAGQPGTPVETLELRANGDRYAMTLTHSPHNPRP